MVKNKPKRLKRQVRWRVARRKKQQNDLLKGTSRTRKKREKKKTVVEKIKEIVSSKISLKEEKTDKK